MKITLFYPHVKFDQYGPCVSISFDCYIVINKLYNYTQRLAPCEFVRKDNIQGNFFLYSLSSFFLLSSFSSIFRSNFIHRAFDEWKKNKLIIRRNRNGNTIISGNILSSDFFCQTHTVFCGNNLYFYLEIQRF